MQREQTFFLPTLLVLFKERNLICLLNIIKLNNLIFNFQNEESTRHRYIHQIFFPEPEKIQKSQKSFKKIMFIMIIIFSIMQPTTK